MQKTKLAIALITAAAAMAADPIADSNNKIIAGDPSLASRTVRYRAAEVVPISTEIRFSTLIELPPEETIIEVTCGDKEFWPVNWQRNLAYVKPAKQNAKTNLNLITESGNVYSFFLSEVSEVANAHADLKVLVNSTDESSIVAMKGKPKFVPADAIAVYQKQAEEAKTQLAQQTDALRHEYMAKEAAIRAEYPGKIRHDYQWNRAAKNPFHVSSIWHDDKFTYIEAAPEEAPAIYEIRDGKQSLIQFELRDGRYVIPKVLDQGYMRVGKSELKFSREG